MSSETSDKYDSNENSFVTLLGVSWDGKEFQAEFLNAHSKVYYDERASKHEPRFTRNFSQLRQRENELSYHRVYPSECLMAFRMIVELLNDPEIISPTDRFNRRDYLDEVRRVLQKEKPAMAQQYMQYGPDRPSVPEPLPA